VATSVVCLITSFFFSLQPGVGWGGVEFKLVIILVLSKGGE
jgi:hypothetical protein